MVSADLSIDCVSPQARPYFLWSENLTNQDLRNILAGAQGEYLQHVYLGRVMREARMAEVWAYITPQEILNRWPNIQRHLGRRRDFWHFLLTTWQHHGLIHG